MKDLAASIVTYHSPVEEVKAAAESLLATYENAHLTIVDNASGEAYLATLRPHLPSAVKLIAAPRNGGFGYGHNIALLHAPRFDYYLVMNPDIVLEPGAVAAMIRFIEEKPEAGLVVPQVFHPDGRRQPLNKRLPNVLDLTLRRMPQSVQRFAFARKRLSRYEMLDQGYDEPCAVPFASGCCMLMRGDVMIRLGGFDERFFLYFEDADLSRRLWEISEAWYCPAAAITHHWHRGSKSDRRLFLVLLESMVTYFTKWGWKWW